MKLLKPSWINHDGQPIYSVDIHPDDVHFVTGGQGDDNTGRVCIWNLKAVLDPSLPKFFCQLDHHNACVNCVRWSNDGRFLASGGDDKIIIIWKLISSKMGGHSVNSVFEKNNLEIWKSVCMLRGHDGDVLDLAWSPEDTYLATCSIDNTVKVWDTQNLPRTELVRTLEGHTSMVKGVTWDPVGKYLASQSIDKTLRIWRTSDWTTEHIVKEPFVECGGTTHVLRLGWSPDGQYLVSAHAMNAEFPTAQIIERDGWKVDKDFVGHRKAVVCVRFNPNIQDYKTKSRHCLVAIGSRDRSISVWSTTLKRPVVVVRDAFLHSVMDLSWSHCGKILMSCSSDGSILVACFSVREIGEPLSQEKKDALYQRYYGNSLSMSANKLKIIPSLEVYMARHQNKKTDKSKESNSTTIPTPATQTSIPPPKPTPPPAPTPTPIPQRTGPTQQIEIRTADGKRRITPMAIPVVPITLEPSSTAPTNSENNEQATPSPREEQGPTATAFTPSEGDSRKDSENLRETMVSTIEHVSFPENKKGNDSSTNTTNTQEGDTPTPVPMEVDELQKVSTTTPMVNGFGNRKDEKENAKGDGESTKKQKIPNGTSSLPETTPVNVIQVKKKRPLENVSVKPKKKFTPASLRPFPQSSETNREKSPGVMATPVTSLSNRTPTSTSKTGGLSKLKLSPVKMEATLGLNVHIKPEVSYSLQVSNGFKRPDGIVNQLKCQHLPTSLNGLDWVVCTDSAICCISGDMHRIIAVCEDATVHVLDVKGRYAMSPFLCSSYPHRMVQNGSHLMIITVKGILHLWNIHSKLVVIKSESLLPLLNQPCGSQEQSIEKLNVDIVNAFIAAEGVPVIFLSNGKAFKYNKEMGTWTLYSDWKGIVSSPMMPDAGDLMAAVRIGQQRKPEPAMISHIKLQLIRAMEMRKAVSIKQWIVVLGKTLASHGLEKELKILMEDLLGPTHSSSKLGTTWSPKLADCVEKRPLLREILNSLLEDLRWQDLFCEFDELLRDVDSSSNTSS